MTIIIIKSTQRKNLERFSCKIEFENFVKHCHEILKNKNSLLSKKHNVYKKIILNTVFSDVVQVYEKQSHQKMQQTLKKLIPN